VDLLAGTEKQIRLDNITNGEPNKAISISLEDKSSALNIMINTVGLILGQVIGTLIFQKDGQE